MALRKLRDIVPDGQRPVSRRSEPNVLDDDTVDQDITDAATVVIGSDLFFEQTEAADRQSSNGYKEDEAKVEAQL
jgi:hypothetical protein